MHAYIVKLYKKSIAFLAGFLFFIGSVAAAEPLTVGFVYVGPIGDHGWSYQHNEGRLAVEKEFGDKVETVYVENVAEGGDAERVLDSLAAKGTDLIFATSFGFMNPTIKVAKRYPQVKFEHATGYKTAKNVSIYNGRFYEGRHILGLIAGHVSKTGVIGYVASFPIPEVIRGINASILAARKINPDMKIKVIWVNSWFDVGKEADAAKTLIDQGADVIMQHTDSPAPVQTAQARGVYAFGQASDMSAFGKDAHLTAIIDDWAPYYVKRTKDVMDGTWQTADRWEGLKEGTVAMGPYHASLEQAVVDQAKQAEQDIISGAIHPFQGPVKDREGSIRIADGVVPDDGFLLGMNFFVEGVEGSLPQ